MFGAVMTVEENCRRFLELALGFPIAKVAVSQEKSIVYHPEYKGVRLDVYASDERRTHYNVEMQVIRKPAPGRRARYYHSQVDMEILLAGAVYEELPNAYVIFICDFDPFGCGKYRYTFRNICTEDAGALLDDGSETLFLSTRGKNRSEVPEPLVKFLDYIKADLAESGQDFGDDYVKSLQDSVAWVKGSREMGERYMIFEEMLRDERTAGLREGKAAGLREGETNARRIDILELLEDIGPVSEDLHRKMDSVDDLAALSVLHKKAARAASLEEFTRELDKLLENKPENV